MPELSLAIERAIDRDRAPGRFLLTGSADALLLPKLAEPLVGRVELLTLWPFSQGELEGRQERFIDGVFAPTLPKWTSFDPTWHSLVERIVIGGYPKVTARRSQQRRSAWFGSYITTILQRDVRDLASIQRLSELPLLLRALASRCGGLLNFAKGSACNSAERALVGLVGMTARSTSYTRPVERTIRPCPSGCEGARGRAPRRL